MFLIIWSYRVSAGERGNFRAAYGPEGHWARLFRRSAAYRGTFLVETDDASRFLTVDMWESESDFDAFMRSNRAEYDQLDHEMSGLTESEEPIARGSTVD